VFQCRGNYVESGCQLQLGQNCQIRCFQLVYFFVVIVNNLVQSWIPVNSSHGQVITQSSRHKPYSDLEMHIHHYECKNVVELYIQSSRTCIEEELRSTG